MADTHPRTLIRSHLLGRLTENIGTEEEPAYRTPCSGRVWPGRDRAAKTKIMPCILAYADTEGTGKEINYVAARVLEIQLDHHAYAATEEALDALLDTLAAATEAVVLSDPTQGGHAQDTVFKRLEKKRSKDGDRYYGTVVLLFDVTYYLPDQDITDLDDFLLFHGEYDLPIPDGVVDLWDKVTLPAPEE